MAKTANYKWVKPTVGGDADTWGTELNTDLDAIDTDLKAVSDDIAAQIAAAAKPPPGGITLFGGTVAPDGWFECDGRALSRTDFADLFAAIGVVWGAGDGSTTFNVPDLRGYFVRGYDHGRGIDSGRAMASIQADSLASHTHTYPTYTGSGNTAPALGGTPGPFSRTTDATGDTETRPKNIAVMYIIKT